MAIKKGSRKWLRRREQYLESLWMFCYDLLGFRDIKNDFHAKEIGIIDEWRRDAITEQCFLWPRGHLKALRTSTSIVVTANGEKGYSQLSEGDRIIGGDGSETVVSKIHPSSIMPLYKVTTNDGRVIECNLDHEFRVRIRQNDKKFKVRTLDWIRERYSKKRYDKRDGKTHYEHVVEIEPIPVYYKPRQLDVDPYTLGVWLGDGTASCGNITSADPEIFEYSPYPFEKKRYGKYVYLCRGLIAKLRGIGVFKNKHIPDDYIFCGYDQRVELLRGLMDTDGTCHKDGGIAYFTNTNERLVSGIIRLVRSLGGVAIDCECDTYCNGKKFRAHFVSVKLPFDINPFNLKRKANMYTGLKRDLCIRITDIEYIGDHEANCITVSSEDGMFIANDYFPTHNSSIITIGQSLQDICRDPNVRILILNATSENAEGFLDVIQQNIMSNDKMDFFFPGIRPEKGSTKWTKNSITVSRPMIMKEPTVRAIGIGTNIVSQHYDKIRFDDIVSYDNSDTPDKRGRVKGYHEMAQAVLEPGGLDQLIGTRYDFEDLYNDLLESGLYKWSEHALQEETNKLDSDGEPIVTYIFPQKFNAKIEDKLKMKMSGARFSAQYYNRPILHEDQLFKEGDIKYYEDLPPNGTTIITVDPASSTKSHADRSAIMTCYWVPVCYEYPFGAIFVIHYSYDKYPTLALFKMMFTEYMQFRPHFMSVEVAGSQSGSFWEFLCQEIHEKKYGSMNIRPFTPSTKSSKYERIAMLQPWFQEGRLFMRKEHIQLKDQLTRYTGYKRHERDDLIDALAQQLQVFTMPEPVNIGEHKENDEYELLYDGIPY